MKISKILKLRENEQGIIGMHKNELLEVGENYGLLENPHFDNYIEINDYEQLKQYVRQHHKNGYGGFYSI